MAVPIHQTTLFSFDNAQHAADLFDLKVEGNIYSRIMNPNCAVLEQRVAAQEVGIAGLAVASAATAPRWGECLLILALFSGRKHANRFPLLNEPDVSYHGVSYTRDVGDAAFIARARVVPLRNMGTALSAQAAWNLLQGLETLSLLCTNALAVAKHLESHPARSAQAPLDAASVYKNSSPNVAAASEVMSAWS